MKALLAQMTEWKSELLAGSAKQFATVRGVAAGLGEVAADISRRLTEREIFVAQDLPAFEPCGLFDYEYETILNSEGLSELVDENGQTVARKDPETGEIWVAGWVRILPDDSETRERPDG